MRAVPLLLLVGSFTLSPQSCGLLSSADSTVAEEIMPMRWRLGKHDTVGSSITWRYTHADPTNSDIVERTFALVADLGPARVLEERETRRNGQQVVTARVLTAGGWRYDGTMFAAYRGKPDHLGRRLRMANIMNRSRYRTLEADRTLGSEDIETVVRTGRHGDYLWPRLAEGERPEIVHVPAGVLECARAFAFAGLLYGGFTTTGWVAERRVPLSALVKTVKKTENGETTETRELVRYAWHGAKPALELPQDDLANVLHTLRALIEEERQQ